MKKVDDLSIGEIELLKHMGAVSAILNSLVESLEMAGAKQEHIGNGHKLVQAGMMEFNYSITKDDDEQT